jgi:hypothetical protein
MNLYFFFKIELYRISIKMNRLNNDQQISGRYYRGNQGPIYDTTCDDLHKLMEGYRVRYKHFYNQIYDDKARKTQPK